MESPAVRHGQHALIYAVTFPPFCTFYNLGCYFVDEDLVCVNVTISWSSRGRLPFFFSAAFIHFFCTVCGSKKKKKNHSVKNTTHTPLLLPLPPHISVPHVHIDFPEWVTKPCCGPRTVASLDIGISAALSSLSATHVIKMTRQVRGDTSVNSHSLNWDHLLLQSGSLWARTKG